MDINTKFIIYFLVSAVGIVAVNDTIKAYFDYDLVYVIVGGLLFGVFTLWKNQEDKLNKLIKRPGTI